MAPKTLIAILLLIFSGATFFLLVAPQFGEVRDLGGTKARLQEELATTQGKITSTKKAIGRFMALEEEDIARIEAGLPEEVDVPNLLVLVESLIFSSGLITQDIDVRVPEPVVRRPSPQAASARPGSIAPRFLNQAPEEDRGYKEVAISFAMLGTYESFKGFLQAAEQSLRIFDVETISFFSAASGEASGVIRFSMKMNTYYRE